MSKGSSMDRAVAEGWASLPTDNPQPTDGYDIHPIKYWKGVFTGGHSSGGGNIADSDCMQNPNG